MNKTFIPSTNYNKRKWYVIDCKDKQLGRLASSIVPLLTGKTKSIYHPSLDVGDYVILINSEELKIDRDVERFHVYEPGRPGSSLKRLVNILPKRIIENSVFNLRCLKTQLLLERAHSPGESKSAKHQYRANN